MSLIKLLRARLVRATFSEPVDLYTDADADIISKIQTLDCSDKNLTSLPFMPNLTELYCTDNFITELPNFPNLIKLDCSVNNLTEIPCFPKLMSLHCAYNFLESLPAMPLTTLDCSYNNFQNLSTNAKIINCSFNYLKTISANDAKILYCANNQIRVLSKMPNLVELNCTENPLPFFTLHSWKKDWWSPKTRILEILYWHRLKTNFYFRKHKKEMKIVFIDILYNPFVPLANNIQNLKSEFCSHNIILP